MKKIVTLFILLFSLHAVSIAQNGCPPCPDFFMVRDTINCNFADMHGQAPVGLIRIPIRPPCVYARIPS
ncbi:hypothetical protein EMGBS15_17720 [Filimonas sp.]|nr:hypothetical protein EMGBS15_17720 [Filimonas sp.]